jgi:hypothetical protein
MRNAKKKKILRKTWKVRDRLESYVDRKIILNLFVKRVWAGFIWHGIVTLARWSEDGNKLWVP